MKLTARSLMYILIALVILVFVATAGGFYLTQSKLHDYAVSITQLNANAKAGDTDVSTLERIEATLKQNQGTINSAKEITTANAQYGYQDKIIEDITAIAARSGVTVTSFDFSAAAAGSTPAAPAPTAPPANPSATTPAVPGGVPGAGAAPAAAAVKSVVTTVTIKNPLKYSTLMNFIQAIEFNRMKMQIAKVSLASGDDGNVTSQTFAIEVYTK